MNFIGHSSKVMATGKLALLKVEPPQDEYMNSAVGGALPFFS